MTEFHYIADLLLRRFAGDLSVDEEQQLQIWLDESTHHRAFFEEINDEERLRELILSFREKKPAASQARVRQRLEHQLFPERVVHRIHLLKTAWVRYAAAIIILFGIGAYLWNTQQKENPASVAEASANAIKNDVAPGSNRAVLTLSDGRKVELTPATDSIAEPGTVIQNTNGRLEYGKAVGKVVFNTMSTPRGGQYQLTLPDGTNVWLNAASSITYPTAFVTNRREVTITGEAYFEVKKNPSKPFVVKTPKEDITVLGTSFNVNAYADEPVMKTSLLEGSVKVGNETLRPGQAFINGKVVATNVYHDIAWKNGVFIFQDRQFEEVMRQISRWYDIEVVYPHGIPQKEYGGELKRNLTLSQILKVLEKLDVSFQLEGRKLIIKP